MQFEINSTWDVKDVDGLDDGLYRLLASYKGDDLFILFNMSSNKKLQRPVGVSIKLFSKMFKREGIKSSVFDLPFYQLVSESDIPKAYIEKRNEHFDLIKELVLEPDFLFNIVLNQRCGILPAHAKSKGTYVQKIYRVLNQYWRYGQDINALVPAYKNSGGPGEPRLAGVKKRGAPVHLSTLGMIPPSGKNTTEDDKKKFLKAIKKYGLKGRPTAISRVYDKMLNELYADEILQAEQENRAPIVPNLSVFRYWIKKLVPESEMIRKRTNKGDFQRNKRGLRGAATDHSEVPGSYFELDATVLDVHIVSEFNRNQVIGRPTLYYVVDKESKMVVGIHVSMEYASWRAGRQALVNSFTSKKNILCAL